METRISFRASDKLKAALKIAAKRDRRKLSNFIVLLLEEGLEKAKVERQNEQQSQSKEAVSA